MTPVHQIGTSEVLLIVLALWLVTRIVRYTRRSIHTTALNGPPRTSLIFGVSRYLSKSPDAGILYEQWAAEYGPAYRIPGVLGLDRIVLCDPRAIAHYYTNSTMTYVKPAATSKFIEKLFGRGLLWAEGESHKRQRKALTPAFSNAAIRRLTSVFYDSAYKMKGAWDSILESGSDGTIIEVQHWMNRVSLDSIGIAGFSHDFHSLDGVRSSVVETFESFETSNISFFSGIVFILAIFFPFLTRLPTQRNKLLSKLRLTMSDIARELLEKTRKEKEGDVDSDKSVIGLLIKAENANTQLRMTQEEVSAQMNTLLLAGYETTSISLTWALIELSRRQEKQDKLREELAQLKGTDPTWDQLTSGLPYLDSVVHEVLRVHPPVRENTLLATRDDVIPLSSPVTTRSGNTVTSLTVAKGTLVTTPISCMNRSEAFWGPNAKEFEPERWLTDSNLRSKEIQGHRSLLTFVDGPRICLGKAFALAEFKAVLSVLIRNYKFELPDGVDTQINIHRSLLPRPKVVGQDGAKVPLRVRRAEY